MPNSSCFKAILSEHGLRFSTDLKKSTIPTEKLDYRRKTEIGRSLGLSVGLWGGWLSWDVVFQCFWYQRWLGKTS